MARPPTWFDHLDDAVIALHQFPAPTVERPDIERLFCLSRRDAIRLLHKFGAEERKDRLTIGRDKFLRSLNEVRQSAEFLAERRRREILREKRTELRRQNAAREYLLPVQLQPQAPAAVLPDPVKLYRNRLVVDFPDGAHDELLARLLEVARTARDDPEGFRIAVEEAPRGG